VDKKNHLVKTQSKENERLCGAGVKRGASISEAASALNNAAERKRSMKESLALNGWQSVLAGQLACLWLSSASCHESCVAKS
jgi:hypothetical protein